MYGIPVGEEELKKWPVKEQQGWALYELEILIEAEMQIAEEMPVNGFVRDSGDGEYWLDGFRTELGTAFFNDDLNDLVNSLACYLRDVQFESRELVLQGLAFAEAIVGQCKKNTNHWLSGLGADGEPLISQPAE